MTIPVTLHPLILCVIFVASATPTAFSQEVNIVDQECCARGQRASSCDEEHFLFDPSLNNDWNMYCKNRWMECCMRHRPVIACAKGAGVAREGGDCSFAVPESDAYKVTAINCCNACRAGRTAGISGPPHCKGSGNNGLVDQTFALCCQEKAVPQTSRPPPPPLPPPSFLSNPRAVAEPTRDQAVTGDDSGRHKEDLKDVADPPSDEIESERRDAVRDNAQPERKTEEADTPVRPDSMAALTCGKHETAGPNNTCVGTGCHDTSCPKHHLCTVADGSVRCDTGCHTGFIMENETCADINECDYDGPDCDAIGMDCRNTEGAYECVDRPSNGTSREQDAEESFLMTTETPVADEAAPDCPSGHEFKGNKCEDVDECADGTHRCLSDEKCINEVGSHMCEKIKCEDGMKIDDNKVCVKIECPDGYEYDSFSENCNDVDECLQNRTACQKDENCKNTDGSFECEEMKCKPGFVWTSSWISATCTDIDECKDRTHNCTELQECRNNEGSFDCDCKPGYEWDNQTEVCRDVDECLKASLNNCNGSSSTCNNTVGSYECVCNDGYEKNSVKSCTDIDECAKDPCTGNGRCINKQGSYECLCNTGFILDENKTCVHDGRDRECHGEKLSNGTCKCPDGFWKNETEDRIDCYDINECVVEEAAPCRSEGRKCFNTYGGHECIQVSCPDQYVPVAEREGWCRHSNLSKLCLTEERDCLKRFEGAATISYGYASIYHNVAGLPVRLYTMEGLANDKNIDCIPSMVSVQTNGSTLPADFTWNFKTEFDRVKNEFTVDLVKPIRGPQTVDLRIDVLSRQLSDQIQLIHTSHLKIFVSKYNVIFGQESAQGSSSRPPRAVLTPVVGQ